MKKPLSLATRHVGVDLTVKARSAATIDRMTWLIADELRPRLESATRAYTIWVRALPKKVRSALFCAASALGWESADMRDQIALAFPAPKTIDMFPHIEAFVHASDSDRFFVRMRRTVLVHAAGGSGADMLIWAICDVMRSHGLIRDLSVWLIVVSTLERAVRTT